MVPFGERAKPAEKPETDGAGKRKRSSTSNPRASSKESVRSSRSGPLHQSRSGVRRKSAADTVLLGVSTASDSGSATPAGDSKGHTPAPLSDTSRAEVHMALQQVPECPLCCFATVDSLPLLIVCAGFSTVS